MIYYAFNVNFNIFASSIKHSSIPKIAFNTKTDLYKLEALVRFAAALLITFPLALVSNIALR